MEPLKVKVLDAPISCQASPSGLCNGTTDGQFLLIRDIAACPGRSAYTHEVMHHLQLVMYRYLDYGHIEPDVWSIADGAAPGSCP